MSEPSPASPAPSASPADGLRFAFGTLTVLPAGLTRWDRPAARAGMLCAPVVGLVVGVLAAATGLALLALGAGAPLAAVASVAVPAALTRGLHLDGLADTADGLGSGRPAEDALRIMKQSDVGPFGVLTLVLVLLAQVAALAQAYGGSWARGALAAVVSAVAARVALTLAARAPACRPPGRRDWARRSRGRCRCGARRRSRCSPRGCSRARARRWERTTRCAPGWRWWRRPGRPNCCCGAVCGGSAG